MMDRALSYEWAGLAIASLVLLAGLGLFRRGARCVRPWLRFSLRSIGGATMTIGLVLLIGASRHLYDVHAVRSEYPAPGRLIDVGGYRMHILAEGPDRTELDPRLPTVVWIPGGYAAGYSLHHLHERIKSETRSILVDRAGTGWSDRGPFPRDTRTQVAELAALLDGAGEEGPFVLVAHSFGGLLIQNFAAAHPDEVVGLVLLDTMQPDIARGPGAPLMKLMAWYTRLGAVCRLFGFGFSPAMNSDSENSEQEILSRALRADVYTALEALSRRAVTGFSQASAFTSFVRFSDDQVREPGSLGSLPLLVVERSGMYDTEMEPAEEAMLRRLAGVSEEDWPEYKADFDRWTASLREQLVRLSTRGEKAPPPSDSHYFPYEMPDVALEHVRAMLAEAWPSK